MRTHTQSLFGPSFKQGIVHAQRARLICDWQRFSIGPSAFFFFGGGGPFKPPAVCVNSLCESPLFRPAHQLFSQSTHRLSTIQPSSRKLNNTCIVCLLCKKRGKGRSFTSTTMGKALIVAAVCAALGAMAAVMYTKGQHSYAYHTLLMTGRRMQVSAWTWTWSKGVEQENK